MNSSIQRIIERIRDLGIDHDILKSLTIVGGVAINDTPLRIGKGRGELGEVDVPILRDHKSRIYIPGSSLKGVLRAFSEVVARGSGYSRICTPHTQELCSYGAELLNYILQCAYTSHSAENLLKSINLNRISEIAGRRLERELQSRVVSEIKSMLNGAGGDVEKQLDTLIRIVEVYSPCIVCRVFGNQALASKITVFDLYPLAGEDVKVATRTRVAIDRFRDAARSGALFDYEFIPAGYRWSIRLELKNIDITKCTQQNSSNLCRLLTTILTSLTQGIGVGGMRSIGCGVLRLVPEETRVIVYRIENLTVRKAYDESLSKLIESLTKPAAHNP